MSDTSIERDDRWLAADGRWYPLAVHPDPARRPGWRLAADGRWYPPGLPPGRPAPLPRERRRGSGRGWAIAVVGLLGVLLLGSLAGDDDQQSRLASERGSATTTTAAVRQAPPETTTLSPASTTTVVATTAAAAAVGDLTAVRSITDGDTFRTGENLAVRIIGVDTPERGDCFFAEATAHLAALIPVGTSIRLEYDVDRVDRYGRTLAYVYRAGDDLFVNAAMARDGFAQQMTIPPNVAHAEDFRLAVAEARDAGRGLWGGCQGQQAAAPAPASPATTTTVRWATTTTAVKATPTACHSSYAGTCIPPDVSDADCAGGSGNGPWYVRESNVRVVGPDVFDLDRDNDGIGCES